MVVVDRKVQEPVESQRLGVGKVRAGVAGRQA
jgi:hypothetical protein